MAQQHQDKLVVSRTQAVQGHPVAAQLEWNGEPIGELEMPFGAWLKFKRLLEKGVEQDARENYALQLKLSIKGMAPAPEVIRAIPPSYDGVAGTSQGLAESIASTLGSRDDDDPDADPAIQQAEAAEQRIRTARGGQ